MIKEYTALGLMSGTSGDGVDASIVKSDGSDNYKVILNKYFKYSLDISNGIYELKEKINNKKDLTTLNLELNSIEEKITLFHAESSKNLLQDNNVDVVGFHGQTIYHNPKEKISKQLGNGKLLSDILKKDIIYNFRKNDLENNGEGAPLTPIFHKLILQKKKIDLPVSILNLGGIANITTVYKDNITSSDIGPANCLIDKWIKINANKHFDKDGQISSKGSINKIILDQALDNYYNNDVSKLKSYDTKDFDLSFVRGLSLEDGAATLIEYTAEILSQRMKNHKIYLSGGGRKNKYLINRIKSKTKDNVCLIDEINIDGDFIESQAFAFLAIRSLLNLPISFPETTGCSKPTVGGELIKY